MQRSLALAALAATVLLGACQADVPVGPSSAPHVNASLVAPPKAKRVVIVSVDGLRGDALRYMPALSALTPRAVWSDSMSTINPAITLPGHLAMMTGRNVARFGVISNDVTPGTMLNLTANGISSIGSWVQRSGGTSAAVIGGGALVPTSMLPLAKTLFGVDTIVVTELTGTAVIDAAIPLVTGPQAPTFTFLHIEDVDGTGHNFGYVVPNVRLAGGRDSLGTDYLNVVRDTDANIARLYAALEPEIAAGNVAFIVTADHGGGRGEGCVAGRPAHLEHCTSNSGDRLIPFVLVAANLVPRRLGSLDARITTVAPTMGKLLSLPIPSGTDNPIPLATTLVP